MKLPSHHHDAFSIWKVLLLLGLLAILGALSLPSIGAGPARTEQVRTLNNLRQLHLAIQTMAEDNHANYGPLDWTCVESIPLPLSSLTNSLIVNGYLTADDFQKLTSYRKKRLWFHIPVEDVVNFYAVQRSDPGDTVLLAKKNWHGPNTTLSGEPYGGRFCIVFQKGGNGQIIPAAALRDGVKAGSGGAHHFTVLQ